MPQTSQDILELDTYDVYLLAYVLKVAWEGTVGGENADNIIFSSDNRNAYKHATKIDSSRLVLTAMRKSGFHVMLIRLCVSAFAATVETNLFFPTFV